MGRWRLKIIFPDFYNSDFRKINRFLNSDFLKEKLQLASLESQNNAQMQHF